MSLLTRKNARCGVSSSSLSRRSLRVFPSLTWCLKRRTVDSCGNSTCLKTPQSGFLEEAEAVPVESNGTLRKTNQRIRRSLYQLRGLIATTFFDGASKRSPSPKTYEKRLKFNRVLPFALWILIHPLAYFRFVAK